MSTIELQALRKVFDDGHHAVAGVDLTIDHGEFFVVVGPSGCGKTSLLRMVAGLEPISGGDVIVDGQRVNGVPANDRDLSMIFQDSLLYPHMTVRENLGFPLRMAEVRKRDIKRRVREVASLFGIADVLDRHPGRLSGGQRQRVAMGRAIVRRPALILMDEPMSNLDAKLRTELRAEIADMHRRLDATTIYVTHDQVEAMSLGDRVAVMRAGRVVQCAPPTELYRSPVDVFVATFIGSPSMNVVRGVVVADGNGLAVRLGHDLITLDETTAHRWSAADLEPGRTIAVGLRPESLRPDDSGQLVVSVEFVERLGAGRLVHATMTASAVRQSDTGLEIDDAPWSTIVMATEDDAELGLWKPLRLAVDPADLYVFDLATGAAIRTPSPVVT